MRLKTRHTGTSLTSLREYVMSHYLVLYLQVEDTLFPAVDQAPQATVIRLRGALGRQCVSEAKKRINGMSIEGGRNEVCQ